MRIILKIILLLFCLYLFLKFHFDLAFGPHPPSIQTLGSEVFLIFSILILPIKLPAEPPRAKAQTYLFAILFVTSVLSGVILYNYQLILHRHALASEFAQIIKGPLPKGLQVTAGNAFHWLDSSVDIDFTASEEAMQKITTGVPRKNSSSCQYFNSCSPEPVADQQIYNFNPAETHCYFANRGRDCVWFTWNPANHTGGVHYFDW